MMSWADTEWKAELTGVAAQKVCALEDQLDALNKKLQQKDRQLDSLQGQLDKEKQRVQERKHEYSELEREMQRAEKNLSERQSALDRALADLGKKSELVSKLENKVSVFDELKMQLSSVEQDKMGLVKELSATQESFAAQNNELKKVAATYDELQKRFMELQRVQEVQVENNEKFSSENKRLAQMVQDQSENLMKHVAEIKELTATLSATEEKLSSALKKSDEYYLKLNETTTELSKKNDELVVLRKSFSDYCDEASSNISSLNKKLEFADAEVLDVKSKLESAIKCRSDSDMEIVRLNTLIEKSCNDIRQLQKDYEFAILTSKEKDDQLASVMQELETLNEQMKAMSQVSLEKEDALKSIATEFQDMLDEKKALCEYIRGALAFSGDQGSDLRRLVEELVRCTDPSMLDAEPGSTVNLKLSATMQTNFDETFDSGDLSKDCADLKTSILEAQERHEIPEELFLQLKSKLDNFIGVLDDLKLFRDRLARDIFSLFGDESQLGESDNIARSVCDILSKVKIITDNILLQGDGFNLSENLNELGDAIQHICEKTMSLNSAAEYERLLMDREQVIASLRDLVHQKECDSDRSTVMVADIGECATVTIGDDQRIDELTLMDDYVQLEYTTVEDSQLDAAPHSPLEKLRYSVESISESLNVSVVRPLQQLLTSFTEHLINEGDEATLDHRLVFEGAISELHHLNDCYIAFVDSIRSMDTSFSEAKANSRLSRVIVDLEHLRCYFDVAEQLRTSVLMKDEEIRLLKDECDSLRRVKTDKMASCDEKLSNNSSTDLDSICATLLDREKALFDAQRCILELRDELGTMCNAFEKCDQRRQLLENSVVPKMDEALQEKFPFVAGYSQNLEALTTETENLRRQLEESEDLCNKKNLEMSRLSDDLEQLKNERLKLLDSLKSLEHEFAQREQRLMEEKYAALEDCKIILEKCSQLVAEREKSEEANAQLLRNSEEMEQELAKMDVLENENKRLKDECLKLTARLAENEFRITALEEEKACLELRISEYEKIIADSDGVTAKLEAANAEIQSLTERLDFLAHKEADFVVKAEELNDMTNKCLVLESEKQTLLDQHEGCALIEEKLNEAVNNNDALLSQLQTFEDQVALQSSKLEEYEKIVKGLKQKLSNVEERKAELQEKVEALENEKFKADELEVAKCSLETELDELRTQNRILKEDAAYMAEQLTDSRAECDEALKQLATIENDKAASEDKLRSAYEDIEKIQSTSNALRSQVDEVVVMLSASLQRAKQVAIHFAMEIPSSLEDFLHNLEEYLEKNIEDQKDALDNKNSQIEDIKGVCEMAQNSAEEAQKLLVTLKSKYEEDIASLKSALAQHVATEEALKAEYNLEVGKLKTRCVEVELELQETVKQLESNNDNIKDRESECIAEREKLAETIKAKLIVEQLVESLQQRLDTSERRVVTLEREKVQLLADLGRIESLLDLDNHEDREQLLGRIDKLAKSEAISQALEFKNQELTNTLELSFEDIARLELRITTLEKEVDTAKADAQKYRELVDCIQAQVSHLETTLEDQRQRIEQQEQEIIQERQKGLELSYCNAQLTAQFDELQLLFEKHRCATKDEPILLNKGVQVTPPGFRLCVNIDPPMEPEELEYQLRRRDREIRWLRDQLAKIRLEYERSLAMNTHFHEKRRLLCEMADNVRREAECVRETLTKTTNTEAKTAKSKESVASSSRVSTPQPRAATPVPSPQKHAHTPCSATLQRSAPATGSKRRFAHAPSVTSSRSHIPKPETLRTGSATPRSTLTVAASVNPSVGKGGSSMSLSAKFSTLGRTNLCGDVGVPSPSSRRGPGARTRKFNGTTTEN